MSKDKRPVSPNQDGQSDSKRSKSTYNPDFDADYLLDYDSSNSENESPRGRVGEGSFGSSRTGGVVRSSSRSPLGGEGGSHHSNGGVGGSNYNNGGEGGSYSNNGGVGGSNYNNGGEGGSHHNNGGVGGGHHNNGGNPVGVTIGNGEVGVDGNDRPSTPPAIYRAMNVATVPPAVTRPTQIRPPVPIFNLNQINQQANQVVQAAQVLQQTITNVLANYNNTLLSTAPTPQGGSPANPGSPATNPGSPGLGGDNNQVGEGGHTH